MAKELNRDNFALILETATRAAGYPVERGSDFALTITMHGQPMRCDLESLYATYRGSPKRLDDIVDAHLAALRKVPPLPPEPTEQEAKESILPLLNTTDILAALDKRDIPLPVHRPFAAGLIVTYVIDTPLARAYFSAAMLDKLDAAPDVALDFLHGLALDNLRKRTRRRDTQAFRTGDQTMLVCETKDGYAATRVLLPDLMDDWARRIPGRMLIGIPNRDFLIAFSDRDPQHVAAITSQVRRDARRREHALTPELLAWQAGRIRALDPHH